MKKYLFAFMSVLLLVGMAGCGSDGDEVNDSIDDTTVTSDSVENKDSTIVVSSVLEKYSVKLVKKEQLPTWLIERIEFYSDPRKAPYINVFRADDQKSTLYFIENPYSSSIFTELYDAQGMKINVFEDGETYRTYLNYLSGLDWVCIYVLRN